MLDDARRFEDWDRNQISLKRSDEVAYWTKRFGVPREELEDAINVVGNSVEAVERHFARVRERRTGGARSISARPERTTSCGGRRGYMLIAAERFVKQQAGTTG